MNTPEGQNAQERQRNTILMSQNREAHRLRNSLNERIKVLRQHKKLRKNLSKTQDLNDFLAMVPDDDDNVDGDS